MTLYYALRILHLVAMALWLGAALWVAGDVKRTLALGPAHFPGLAGRILPALRLDVWAGAATLLTGAALAAVARTSRIGIAVGFALSVFLFILAMTILLPVGKRVVRAIEPGGDMDEARRLAKSLAAFSGVAHLLWVLALVAMVLPY